MAVMKAASSNSVVVLFLKCFFVKTGKMAAPVIYINTRYEEAALAFMIKAMAVKLSLAERVYLRNFTGLKINFCATGTPFFNANKSFGVVGMLYKAVRRKVKIYFLNFICCEVGERGSFS